MEKKDLKLDKNEVVHCRTEELANKVLQIAHDCGYKWTTGTNFICNNNYSRYEIITCYDLNAGAYGAKSVYINNNYKIIPAEEFIKRHEKSDEKKRMTRKEYYKDIQVGDRLWGMLDDKWVEVIKIEVDKITVKNEIEFSLPLNDLAPTLLYEKVDIIDFYNLPPKPKWVPKDGEQFWKISLDYRSALSVNSAEMIQYYQKVIEQGNYFKTEAEAQEALNKMLEILKK